jgi:hypothetical protein
MSDKKEGIVKTFCHVRNEFETEDVSIEIEIRIKSKNDILQVIQGNEKVRIAVEEACDITRANII